MRLHLSFIAIGLCLALTLQAKDYKVTSPDNKIEVTVSVADGIKWSVSYNGTLVAGPCAAAMELSTGVIPAPSAKVTRSFIEDINNTLSPVVPHKNSTIPDNCRQMTIRFNDGVSIIFRAYNDGVAYRFNTTQKGNITVRNEIFTIAMPAGTETWYPTEQSFMSHNERYFYNGTMDTIGPKHLASLPALVQTKWY